MTNQVTFALPSKGAIAEPTINFLHECGLKVDKPNPRQYVGTIPMFPEMRVLFQRVKDVAHKVADGTAHIGITGLDIVHEYPSEAIITIHKKLNYGHCKLLVAVPETWVDVDSMQDLVDVAIDFREFQLRNIRVATTYVNSARRFLHQSGLHHFTLVKAEGAIEAAPTLGYADIIIDLAQTGTTLRENHLKPINDGVILSSQASLIGNKTALTENPYILEATHALLEFFDATIFGRQYHQLIANIKGNSIEDVARNVSMNKVTRGLQGPTIAPVFNEQGETDLASWYAVTIMVQDKNLRPAVDHLRSIGGKQIIAVPVRYLYHEVSPSYNQLLQQLGAKSI